MIPRPAQYLLRFDDLCPTMSREKWQRFEPLIERYSIRPILAVVPDNRDPGLELDEPDPEFWTRMAAMEAAGATIGLHGYRHECENGGRSLVPIHRFSEFAGLPAQTQREWIHAGLELLRGRGLNPRIWVAPRHGFDAATLQALREEGIDLISDGFGRAPFLRGGVMWIPQQLWAPEPKGEGVWTILVHANAAPDAFAFQLEAFLKHYAGQFTSMDRIVAEFRPAELGLLERAFEAAALLGLKRRQLANRLSRRN